MKKYKVVVTGGTFDKFHKGHKDFISFQLKLSDKVLIGVTTDDYAQKKVMKHALAGVDSYAERVQQINSYLTLIEKEDAVMIAPIDSPLIPSPFRNESIEAIVATEDTKRGAEKINGFRQNINLPPFPVELFAMTLASDNKPIASRRIRSGEINREGYVYLSDQVINTTYRLPDAVRNELKKPFGDLIINNNFDYGSLSMHDVITVGDVATRTFLTRNLIPHLSIIDFVIERKKSIHSLTDMGFAKDSVQLAAENPPGVITASLLHTIKEALSLHSFRKKVIIVSGEEDLAVIPVLLRSPLDSYIFYGQPGEGLVKIHVTEERKEFARSLLRRFIY